MEDDVADEDVDGLDEAAAAVAEAVPEVVVSEGQEAVLGQERAQLVVPFQVLRETVADEDEALIRNAKATFSNAVTLVLFRCKMRIIIIEHD